MYKDSLKKLREQVFAQEAPEEPNKPSKGLIRARVEMRPLQDPQTNPYSDWLKTISSMASEIKQSSKSSETSQGGFAEGFASTFEGARKSPDPAESVPPENKDALIRRRGDGPSYYAPRPSKEQNSHEARITAKNEGFRGLIDKHEGGGDYDTLFKFSNREGGPFAGVKVSEMTIGELKEFANGEYGNWSKGELGYKATPMGRYQFVGTTLEAVAKEMGLPDDTVFSRDVQDSMFDYWIGKTLSRGKSLDEKVDLLRGQWEGFKNVPRANLVDMIVKYG